MEKKHIEIRNCKNCGKKFRLEWGKRIKFCSKTCRLDFYKNRHKKTKDVEKICTWCNSAFRTKNNSNTKFCSHGCAHLFGRIRNRIHNIFAFDQKRIDREIKRLEKLGNRYTFPNPHQDLNVFYQLG